MVFLNKFDADEIGVTASESRIKSKTKEITTIVNIVAASVKRSIIRVRKYAKNLP